MKGESWAVEDTWRSIWYAIAIRNGDDPDKAVENHRNWCEKDKERNDD